MKQSSKSEEAVLLGLGAISIAKVKTAELLKMLGKKEKFALKDQQKLRKQLLTRGRKEYQSLTRAYERALHTALKTLDIPSRQEFEALKRRVGGKKK